MSAYQVRSSSVAYEIYDGDRWIGMCANKRDALALVENGKLAEARRRCADAAEFLCPACGETGPLTSRFIYASPVSPCIKCAHCEAEWRVNLYEADDSADGATAKGGTE